MSFFEELKRRNVIRVGFAYLVGSWLIVQVTETLFPVYGLSDAAIRLVVTILGIGLIPTLLAAWIFERTPEGIKREKDIDRTQSITTKTGRKLDRAIIVVLVVALGYFVFDKFSEGPGPGGAPPGTERSQALEDWENRSVETDRKSLAVLPFTNLSQDVANEPFTLGIHDDLLTHLSRIGSLKTTSRTSVLQYRDTTMPIPEIATELDVAYILEGSIQRAGNRVRINMQLIDGATDEHVWAEIYDRELTAENLFQVQADIAGEVVQSLQATLLPQEQTALAATPTRSMAAYDLYLLGRHHQQTRTEESLLQSVDYFTRAVAEDPGYVRAYAGLAQSNLLLMSYGNMQGSEVFPVADEAINKAMDLDDQLAEVWSARGLYHLVRNENVEAQAALEQAIELDQQSYHAWLWLANALVSMRRYDEHLEALGVAYSLEPMSYPVNNNLAGIYNQRGRFTDARRHYERVDLIDETDVSNWRERIVETWYYEGELARAVIDARELLAVDPSNDDAMSFLMRTHVALGDTVEARRWADESARLNVFDPVQSLLYMDAGDYGGAIAYIEDKRQLIDVPDETGGLFMLFRAAYLGDRIEAASSYLNEYLQHLGGRREVSPGNSWQWDNLLVADFLIRHGEDSPGGTRRGREMLEQAQTVLESRTRHGFHHPSTWFGLAKARAMSGDSQGALKALQEAVDRGFRLHYLLRDAPELDPVRGEPEFRLIQDQARALALEESQRLATATLAEYRPVKVERVIVPREVKALYVGYYTDGNALFHFYFNEDDQFSVKFGRLPPFVLSAKSDSEFYPEEVQSQSVQFILGDDGVVTHALMKGSGNEERIKPTPSPPEVIQLDRDQLQPFVGKWSAQTVEGTEGEVADTDIWTGLISVDDDGNAWLDLDNQARHPFLPYSETGFIIPGFLGTYDFEADPETGVMNRMVQNRDGLQEVFERDQDAPQ